MLRFKYRRAGFFAKWFTPFPSRDGQMMFEIPTGRLSNPTFGPLGMEAENETLVEDLKALLDPYICPSIVVSVFGDRISFDAYLDDNKPVGRFSFGRHVGECGGGFERAKVSDLYKALSCRGCNLRVMYPIWVELTSDLRSWSEEAFPKAYEHLQKKAGDA